MDQNHWFDVSFLVESSSQKDYLNSLSNTMLAFAIITTICIVTISIPQLIKIIKDKKTGEVSLTSFWIFQYGILFWVIYAAFNPGVAYYAPGDAKGEPTLSGYLPTLVGETITILINGTVLFLMHYYKEGMAKWKVWTALGFILLNWAVTIIVFIVHFTTKQCYYIDLNGQTTTIISTTSYGTTTTLSPGKVVPTVIDKKQLTESVTYYIPRFSTTASYVLGFIGPVGVTLPFTPQLIKSFKTKQWQGVSVWLFVLYTFNNIAWLIFFSVAIQDQITIAAIHHGKLGQAYGAFVGGLAWQCIGTILFAIQLAFTVDDIIKRKKGLRVDAPLQKPVSIEKDMLIE